MSKKTSLEIQQILYLNFEFKQVQSAKYMYQNCSSQANKENNPEKMDQLISLNTANNSITDIDHFSSTKLDFP